MKTKMKFIAFLAVLCLLFGALFALTTATAEEDAEDNVIEIYVIAGQSNAQGNSFVPTTDRAEMTAMDARYTAGFDNVLYYGHPSVAVGSTLPALSLRKAAFGQGVNSNFIGPELGMAKYLADRNDGGAFGLIKYAVGGTSIYDNVTDTLNAKYGNWYSPYVASAYGVPKQDASISGFAYDILLQVVEGGLAAYREAGYTPVIKGVAWMQGEQDSYYNAGANNYARLLTAFLSGLKTDLAAISGQNLAEMPVVIGKIHPTYPGAYTATVRKQQQQVIDADPTVFGVDTTSFPMPGVKSDGSADNAHYRWKNMLTLGNDFARALYNANHQSNENVINLYLIAGQSNAVGQTDLPASAQAELQALDGRFISGFDDVLYYGYTDLQATSSLPALSLQKVKTGLGMRSTDTYIGPELGMAKYLSDNESDSVYGIVKYAAGASAIYDETTSKWGSVRGNWYGWSVEQEMEAPHVDDVLSGFCYRTFLQVVERALDAYRAAGYTPVVKGVAWMQGESEAGTQRYSALYSRLLSSLISGMRSDLSSVTGSDLSELPVVVAKIPEAYAQTASYTPVVRTQQQAVIDGDEFVLGIDNNGFTLPGAQNYTDAHHYHWDDMVKLGNNFAEALLSVSASDLQRAVFSSSVGGSTLAKNLSARAGATVSTGLIANSGYEFSGVTFADGEGKTLNVQYNVNGSTLSFTMPDERVYVNVAFSAIPQYKVTMSAENGSVYRTNAGRDPYRGDEVTFTFSAKEGYTLSKVTVNGAEVTVDASKAMPTYTMTVTGNVTLSALFAAKGADDGQKDDGKKEGGCASSLTGGALSVAAAVMALGALIVKKKKK